MHCQRTNQRFSAYYSTAAIFKLSYFLCGLFPTLYSTLLFCLKHIFFSGINKKAKSCCQPSTAQTKSRYTPTTTTVPLMPVLKMSEAKLHNVAL